MDANRRLTRPLNDVKYRFYSITTSFGMATTTTTLAAGVSVLLSTDTHLLANTSLHYNMQPQIKRKAEEEGSGERTLHAGWMTMNYVYLISSHPTSMSIPKTHVSRMFSILLPP